MLILIYIILTWISIDPIFWITNMFVIFLLIYFKDRAIKNNKQLKNKLKKEDIESINSLK